MRNNWLFSIDPDGGSPYMLPVEFFLTNGFGLRFLHNIGRENLALEAFNRISKFAGSFLVWFSSSSITREISHNHLSSAPENCNSSGQLKKLGSGIHNFTRRHFNAGSKTVPAALGKIGTTVQRVYIEAEKFHSCSVLCLAAALTPPFNNISSNMLALPLESSDVKIHQTLEERPCEVSRGELSGLVYPELNWPRQAIEPRTGIEFPVMLDTMFDGIDTSRSNSEVLVGTGSKTMKIVRIKSLKLYAYGFYVDPSSLCTKLSQKYTSIPIAELNQSKDFFQDLLREDIDMRVRLVVNYDGLKINTVREVFEKSLRARLVKANPNTDYQCLNAFGSFFSQNMPIPAGTVIDFRRTADGQLKTEIGGNQVGSVWSKDLCRAFFGMYIGDLPVSEQTKQEIGKNVADLIKRC